MSQFEVIVNKIETPITVEVVNRNGRDGVDGQDGITTVEDLSLENVDNTSDADKPISDAVALEFDNHIKKAGTGNNVLLDDGSKVSLEEIKDKNNQIVFKNKSLPEPDSVYINNGVGVSHETLADVIFNKITVYQSPDVSNTKVYIKVYKKLTTLSFNPSNLELLYETTQTWSGTVQDTPREIVLNKDVTLLTGESIYVLTSTKTAVKIRSPRLTTSTSENRNLHYTSSSNYNYIFDDVSWETGTSVYIAKPLALYYTNEKPTESLLHIPTKFAAVEGVQINLYLDDLINTEDNGLYTISNIEVVCSKGVIKQRQWQYTATSSDIGDVDIMFNLYAGSEIIESHVATLTTISNSPPSYVKNIMFLGDSLTANGSLVGTCRDNFVDIGGITPLFLGTQGTAPNEHEGNSGKTFNWFTSTNSPFWNGTSINISDYRLSNSYANPFDVVSMQLGVNEALTGRFVLNDARQVIFDAKTLIDAFIADSASTIIIIQLPTYDGNTYGGWGVNYDSTRSKKDYKYNISLLRKLILETFDNSLFNTNVKVGYNALAIDRYYGFGLTSQAGASRITDTEGVHINAVHPIVAGYNQMADACFSSILKEIQSTLGPELYQTGTISNLGGSFMTFISGGVNAGSDGTSGTVTRPRLLWDNLDIGSTYKVVITPTVNSGNSGIRFHDGFGYVLGTNSAEATLTQHDFTFTANGNAFFCLDGRNVVDADIQISLRKVL